MLNQSTIKAIHAILEGYDRKFEKYERARQGKHYKHNELLDIYLKLAAKHNEQEPKQTAFHHFVNEYNNNFDGLL